MHELQAMLDMRIGEAQVLRRKLDRLDKATGLLQTLIELENSGEEPISPGRTELLKTGLSTLELVVRLLGDGPLKFRDLYKAVIAAGYIIPGKDPHKTLSARLSNLSRMPEPTIALIDRQWSLVNTHTASAHALLSQEDSFEDYPFSLSEI
tara:strand:- start:1056 stop:1508 length:453 start_codon:yes stop_codon:yes gene_type:complete